MAVSKGTKGGSYNFLHLREGANAGDCTFFAQKGHAVRNYCATCRRTEGRDWGDSLGGWCQVRCGTGMVQIG